MEENNRPQNDPNLSPEERLDQLLAAFLAEPDMELPPPAQVEAPTPASAFFLDMPGVPENPDADTDDIDILPILQSDILAEELPPAMPEPEAPVQALPTDVETTEPASLEPEAAEPAHLPLPEPETEVPEIGESLAPVEEATEIGVDQQALEAAGLTVVEPDPLPQTPGQPEEPTASIPQLVTIPEISEDKEPKNMTDTPADQQEAPLPEEDTYIPPRRIRPKKKGTYGFFSIPHMGAVAIWLAIIVFVGVGLGNILWEYASDMLAFGRENKTVTITITGNDDLDAICNKLQSNGLIKYPALFKIYADLTDAMDEIKPGTYTLNTLYDYMALKRSMSSYGARVTTKVVIPEGYTSQQIFALLEKKGVATVKELEAAAAKVQLEDYWFLEGVDTTVPNCLEGYLFPDTYQFYLNHDPDGVIEKFLTNFDNRFNDTMKENLIKLNETLSEMMRRNGKSEEYIAQHQMTVREVVIVASMIEKEAANTSEGYKVSSVIYNRLTNPDAYPHLQIDATLVYITGHNKLTAEDLALDSPYNTYKSPGLIPGPISNPSRASLDAALEPAYDDTRSDGSIIYYYYYALNPNTGEHKFSETLAEHDAFLDSLKKNEEETP